MGQHWKREWFTALLVVAQVLLTLYGIARGAYEIYARSHR